MSADPIQAVEDAQAVFQGSQVLSFYSAPEAKIRLVLGRFAGQRDRYIVETPAGIVTEEKPVTEELIRGHLLGQYRIGVFPIVDGRARWCAIDLDSAEPEHARALVAAYREVGLPVKLCTSRSGFYHTWTFFREWMPAHKLRAAVDIVAQKSELPHKQGKKGRTDFRPGIDAGRLYPCDAALFLPLFGLRKSLKTGRDVFVDPETLEPFDLERQWTELAQL